MLKKYLFLLLISFTVLYSQNKEKSYPGIYDEIWTSPSENSRGSMPLGNGDIGINLWAERDGSINFFIGKTDAWDDYCSLLKVGKVKIKVTPNPFENTNEFSQRLDLNNGQIIINSKKNKDKFKAIIWVDVNNPVINVEIVGNKDYSVEAAPVIWRKEKREISEKEKHGIYGFIGSKEPVYSYPDSVLSNGDNGIICLHKNKSSIWGAVLEKMGMAEFSKNNTDPLMNNTFGYLMKGKGFSNNDLILKSVGLNKRHTLSFNVMTGKEPNTGDWINNIIRVSDKIEKSQSIMQSTLHRKYWNDFWKKSYIIVKNNKEGESLAKSYTLQRFVSACAGKGKYPVKFNGSIFNVDSSVKDHPVSPDYRQWGGPFWLQNTRLIYWPMLMNGDYDLVKPFFGMYMNALQYGMEQTKVFYNHKGAFFPETMYFWGSYTPDNFGWDTDYKNFKHIKNQYIRYYVDGSLEVISMMLEYYNHTRSQAFVKDTLLPFAKQILLYYSEHYPRANGKLRIYPSQVLETYWDALNPTNITAGLKWTLSSLIALPDGLVQKEELSFYKNFLKEIPEFPIGKKANKDVILPADSIFAKAENHENGELYSVFPYRHFGTGKPNLELARNTYNNSRVKAAAGWQQHDVVSALLGLTDSAKKYLTGRLKPEYHPLRFPVFWGPNFDWLPDQDHGGNLLLALQFMLLQTDNEKLHLLPAWPKDWDVDFKLNAPDNTSVSGSYQNGKLMKVKVYPDKRMKDVVIHK